jgi:K(+)-stimulated pyrophosphate-energized sodium pump
MTAVGEAAQEMIEEIRRQFREIPGLLDGTGKPDPASCVRIATDAAIKRMVLPASVAIGSPAIIGFGLGAATLGGMLVGALLSAVLLALFSANSGGAWDNAKKMFEEGVEIAGQKYYKGSEPHKAAVVGDTVGDPFKDTAGPSINILLKLISIVALVIGPLIR